MNTDRTAAPSRTTALAQPSVGARAASAQGPPSDMFSLLLGAAATPRDVAPRHDQPRHRRDDAPRAKDATKPASDDLQATDEPTLEEDAPARLVTAELFALQLTSPLPAAPAPPAPATPAAAAVATEGEPAVPAVPTLQGFGAQLSGVAAQTPAPAAGDQAPLGEPLPAGPAPAAATAPAVAPTPVAAEADAAAPTPAPAPAAAAAGGIPLPTLAGLTAASAVDAPAPPAVTAQATPTDVPATPLPDSANAAPASGDAQTSADGQPQNQPAPTVAPTPTEQAAKQTAKPADAPVPAATTAQVSAPAPVAPAVPLSTPTGLERLVPLYRAAETTALMIHIASQRGITHARLNLKPAELGGIEVRLQTSPQGVSAQLVADSPEAARMLHAAADDLRRNLEARDVNLLSLDVSTSSDRQNQQAAAGSFSDGFGDSAGAGRSGSRNGSNGDAGLEEAPAAAETTLVLPNGVLVDVLA